MKQYTKMIKYWKVQLVIRHPWIHGHVNNLEGAKLKFHWNICCGN